MPVLWKYDSELGIVFFCSHCKTFQCTETGSCTKCGENIDWEQKIQYAGRVYWN